VSTWKFDPAHTSIEFVAKHMMITNVKGHFKIFDGQIVEQGEDPLTAVVDVTIQTASLETGAEQRDGHLRSPDFFDVANYPTITFHSTKVESRGGDRYAFAGDLTIRGVTRPVELDVTLEGKATSMQGKKVYAFNATTSFNRKDFGLNWNVALETGGWLVGEQVKINIDAEIVEESLPPAEATASAQSAQSAQ
jgi:polyisoprenoid-binding protein YceI